MIFTGIEILFFVLGVITTLGIATTVYYHRKFKFNAGAWASIGIGLFLFVFTIAWSVSSVLEGEPRASSMGMIIFGIPSIILLVLGRKLALKNNRS
ncbi:hypothetical protein E9993_03055 [Labilibacter sediminis]|nr:hypothetical protein E9993_03055 [Labilibacter sediminis]